MSNYIRKTIPMKVYSVRLFGKTHMYELDFLTSNMDRSLIGNIKKKQKNCFIFIWEKISEA